jgi:phenylacetate-CoA ligase
MDVEFDAGLPQLGDWDDLEQLAKIQHEQLATTLGWASDSPFYRSRRLTGPGSDAASTLAALAPTTKADLRSAYPFGMLAVPRSDLATYHESSGTAGQPTPSYYTEQDWIDLTDRYARKWVPITAEDTFLVRTPYALMITGHLAQAAARSRGATVVPGDNRSLAMPYSRVLRVLHDLDVSLTWSMATETLIWAAAAREAELDPAVDFPALRAMFVGGDALSARRRSRISETWGVPVVEEYGSTETGSLAGACPVGALHLWSDRVLFEVLNPQTGELSREGTGQLVVTPLFRRAMPLLRYNLEDDVTISSAPCSCGWALPTVKVFGRSAFAHRVQGVPVTQDVLDDAVFALPITDGVTFWRGRALPDRLEMEIEVDGSGEADAADRLTELVRTTTSLTPLVTARPRGSLVPREVLTATSDVVKPRALFGPDEAWDKALTYY